MRPADPALVYPRYIAGERPPHRKTAAASRASIRPSKPRADPNHPDHEDAVDWLEGYDPDHFNELALKVAGGRIASRRRAAMARVT